MIEAPELTASRMMHTANTMHIVNIDSQYPEMSLDEKYYFKGVHDESLGTYMYFQEATNSRNTVTGGDGSAVDYIGASTKLIRFSIDTQPTIRETQEAKGSPKPASGSPIPARTPQTENTQI
eukprot:Platyproteum_vivax@DN7368_c0_g1_i3.p1